MNKAGLVSLGAVYIYIYISRLLEKEDKVINKINIDNRITISLKEEKI